LKHKEHFVGCTGVLWLDWVTETVAEW